MNENIENNDWMNEAPALAALEKRNPFSVPDGYFENSDEAIFSAVFLDGLKQKTNNNNFEVPQHYFEDLTERIQTQIALSEMPKTENTFAIPENYFDTLQSRITDRIATLEPKKEAKVIPLWRRNIVRYASAACFLLMASFGIYFYQNGSTNAGQQVQSAEAIANEQLLYDIDESTIIDHLETQNTTSSNIKTTSASDTEMENYILSNFSSSDLSQELNN
jgi:negative regulator of sigma E activity